MSKAEYEKVINTALVKGNLFLFAALGLFDIAYDKIEPIEEGYPNTYEGLKYIRLTNLGAYVLGITDEYEAPESISKSSIVLSTDSLTITVDKDDAIAPISLAQFMVQVSPNRFSTDYAIFLKNVQNKTVLENKIKLFKTTIGDDIPENWKAFLDELKQKVNPLTLVEDIIVYKIPKDNAELQKLILLDEKLSTLCSKVENYQVMIKSIHHNKFKKRLEEFGYLI